MRSAWVMKLRPGHEAEYKRKHDEIWPELSALLREAGVSDYSIWLDEETNHLFGVLKRPADHTMDRLPQEAIVDHALERPLEVRRRPRRAPTTAHVEGNRRIAIDQRRKPTAP